MQFAELKEREGLSPTAAALEAARLRFRPILMTSLAFIFGVMLLALSTGAGAGARRSVGTGVMGGMVAATFLAIFFVPMFFKLLATRRLKETRSTEEIREEISHSTGVVHGEPQHCFHHAPHKEAADTALDAPQERGNASCWRCLPRPGKDLGALRRGRPRWRIYSDESLDKLIDEGSWTAPIL